MQRRLLNHARDSRLPLAATILTGFLAGLLTIGQASALSQIVTRVFLGGQSLPDVAGLLRLILLIVFLRAILAWGGEVSANAVAVRVKSDLRRRLFDKILRLGPAYTRTERTGELVNAALAGVEALDAYFSQYLPQLVIATLVPLSILFFVFPQDPLSGLILLLTAPLIPVFMYLIGKTAEALTKRQWDTLGRLSAHFFDSLQGLTTLKELGQSQARARSIADASDRFRDRTLDVLRVTFLSALVLELVATVSTALVAVEVGLRLLYRQMAFQPALFLLLLAPEFYIPLRTLGLRFHAGMNGTSAARRIYEILDRREPGEESREQVAENNQPGEAASPLFSALCFSNLLFTYPGETEAALQDFSFEMQAGEHIALVGSSGAGKSTLVALLLRFIEPEAGQITMNGKPSSEIPLAAWRSRIAWVSQNPFLFHATIAANLRLARPEASDAELAAALRLAHLDGFVQALPDGLETLIGEEGARLSAGQAQRLALARAFLKNAPLLILDEPTSSLDPQQEMLVEASLRELMRDRTVIIIAHRLNTVFQADKIIVLEKGRLVEAGSHSALLAKGGVYAALVNPAVVETQSANSQADPRYSTFDQPASFLNLQPPFLDPRFPISNPKSEISNLQSSSSLFLLPRLLSFLRGSWGWVALSVLLGALTVGSNVGLMGTSAFLISAAALHPQLGTLEVAIVGVRFFGIARGAFRYAERLTTHNVTFRLLARLRTWFYQKLEPLAPARLMQYRSGDLLSRIVSDVDSLENFYVRVVSPSLVAVLIAAGMTVFFARYSPGLAGAYLAFMLLLGLVLPLLAWALSRSTGALVVSQRAGLQSRLVEGIQGLADLLAFGRAPDYAQRLLEQGRVYGDTQRRLAVLTGLSGGLTVLLVNLGMLAVLVVTIPLVGAGRIPGVMLAVLALAASAGFEAVMPLPLAAQTLSSSNQAARRLFEIIDAEPAVVDVVNSEAGVERSPRLSTLACSGLSFTYPGQPQPALQDISFQLAGGHRIAIVGPSGAGKSTLANLLLRFWDYSQGQILLNGLDLHAYPQAEVRRQIGCLSQRIWFFNDTLRQNLLLARPAATQAEIQEAARRAQIHDFILGLPKGYETVIGERGLRLSGGERQRLAIARLLLQNAPIFLLDEPTANLDTLTERSILDTLFSLSGGHSLLFITHRLVGLEAMHEILVMDHGCIVERGPQSELLARRGLYRHLWNLQNRILADQ
jgi:ATP-binding cassette subfamily C protein CydCD